MRIEDPRMIHGLGRTAIFAGLLLSILREGIRRRGFTEFLKRAIHYLRCNGAGLQGASRRWVRRGRQVFAASALPPLNSPRFASYLVDEIDCFTEKKISPLLFAIVAVSSRCPYRCAYCYASEELSQEEEVPLDVLKDAVLELGKAGAKDIFLSGGEPLLRSRDLIEIMDHASGWVEGFWLVTTGWKLDRTLLDEMIQRGLLGIVISLDSHHEDVIVAAKGHLGAFKETLKAIETARNRGLLISVDCLVRPELLAEDQFFEYLEFCRRLGVHFINLFPPSKIGGVKRHDLQCLGPSEEARLEQLIEEVNTGRKYRDYPIAYSATIWEKVRGCSGGKQFMYIDPKGNVRPCPFIKDTPFNIKKDSMDSIIRRLRGRISESSGLPCVGG